MEYRVRYEIDVDAESPLEAAREAWACMRDPESRGPMLEVVPMADVNRIPEWSAECIDLWDEDLQENCCFEVGGEG